MVQRKKTTWKNRKTRALFEATIKLKTKQEAEVFFRDLCTIEELAEMASRWEVVRLLQKGLTYRQIAQKVSMSTTTVARIAQWLNHGEGGYQLMLKRLKLAKPARFQRKSARNPRLSASKRG